MGHDKCAVCWRIIRSNQPKWYLGTKSLWDKACAYGLSIGKLYEPEEVVCKSCHVRFCFDSTKRITQVSPRIKRQIPIESTHRDESMNANVGPQDNEMDVEFPQVSETSLNDPQNAALSQLNIESNNSQASATTSQSTMTSPSIAIPMQAQANKIKLDLRACPGTQRCCFLCRKTVGGRSHIPLTAIVDVWITQQIIIPLKNRCCKVHLNENDKKFNDAAKNKIISKKNEILMSSEEIREFVSGLSAACEDAMYAPMLNFDISSKMSCSDYKTLTGISKVNFDDLYSYCKPHVKDSVNRSSRNALGMFLMKLRLNVSQEIESILFRIKDASKVSLTIESVRSALEKTFTPKYIGFHHLSRDSAKDHQTTFAHTLLKAPENSLVVIVDGTYLYIQKPSDFEMQKKTFSLHKNRNLVKTMMCVMPNGYVIEAEGLFYSDGQNNDAKIFSYVLDKANGFSSFFLPNDFVVADRGFRDVITKAKEKGFNIVMPHFLEKKEKQFSTERANESRIVTLIRWIVESANGRVKNVFKFFSGVIAASSVPRLNSYFRIALAIINAYSGPLFTETEHHKQLAERALLKLEKENALRTKIEDCGLARKTACWEKASKHDCMDFPNLTEDDLEQVTLGKYQISMAALYTMRHLQEDSSYIIYIHKEGGSLIQGKIESRYGSKGKAHQLWIEYKPYEDSENGILAYYCMCKIGSRVVGTCAHITSVLWFMGYARHNELLLKQKRSLGATIINAVEQLRGADEDADGEESLMVEDDGDVSS